MRVVIDANVIISSSLIVKSTSSKVVRLIEDSHVMLISEATMEELTQTILRPKFDRYFKPLDTRIEIISRYFSKAEWIAPSHRVTICRDPKDNMYLELALSAQADCIITGDEDLLSLHPFENISIITPLEFLKQFGVS